MLVVISIDLSQADRARFDTYESKVLALLPRHSGQLQRRIRSLDGKQETHILRFASHAHFRAYLNDPDRQRLTPDWLACGAIASHHPGKDLAT